MHADEVTPASGLGRAEEALTLEVLHVGADRDRDARALGPKYGRHPLEPSLGRVGVGRDRAVGVLVPEVPCPQGGMSAERGGDSVGQERLGVDDRFVCVPVP